jgi:hypothetical protein
MKTSNRNKKVTPNFASSLTTGMPEAKPVPVKTRKPAAVKPAAVEVQYPQEGEKVYRGHYAVRVDVDNALEVQLSINSGEWQACREASGHYWFDWYPSETGSFRIVARGVSNGGREAKSTVRTCQVI